MTAIKHAALAVVTKLASEITEEIRACGLREFDEVPPDLAQPLYNAARVAFLLGATDAEVTAAMSAGVPQ